MTQTYEDFSKYGKEFADTGLKSFASLSKGAQAIATEAGEYTKKSFEAGSAAVEKLFSAKSLDKAIEIQSDYAKQSYESVRRRGHQDRRPLCRTRQGSLQAVRIDRRQGEVISPANMHEIRPFGPANQNPVADARPGFFMAISNRGP